MSSKNIEVEKVLLTVMANKNINGDINIEWEFGENINTYYLIGILEVIKQQLIDTACDEDDE